MSATETLAACAAFAGVSAAAAVGVVFEQIDADAATIDCVIITIALTTTTKTPRRAAFVTLATVLVVDLHIRTTPPTRALSFGTNTCPFDA